ncbi:MAG: MoaD/ThiS family protein [Candidatus Omnitrophica bacterium]|nr:MoaD/ThiS family protein [Candidatus Omnitrophota bacterium]
MKIKVSFFAQLRNFFGTESCVMEISDGATAGELLQRVCGFSRALPPGFPVLMAVNEHYVPHPYRLREGDDIALMPPVAGG